MAGVGPSSECFFVGRKELLAWVNSLLGLSLSKVEQVRATWRRLHSTPGVRRRRAFSAGEDTTRCQARLARGQDI
jgi:hypothetical protein